MKNLYIFTMNKEGQLWINKWEDVKTTRDGMIVTKRDSVYKLAHGNHKYKKRLDKGYLMGLCAEYITFDEDYDINNIKNTLGKLFIDSYDDKIKKINNEKEELLKNIKEKEPLIGDTVYSFKL